MEARDEPPQQIPLAEWLAAGVGFVLVAGTIAFMAYRALSATSGPPSILLQVQTVQAVTDGYVVTIRAANLGPATAAGVKVEGRLKRGPDTVETSETTFTYLPTRSEREGGLFFARNPADFELSLEPKGYEKP